MVYVPAVAGASHVAPLKVPPVALQVTLLVAPPVTFAAKLKLPGATVVPLGCMPEIFTLVAVALQLAVVVDATPVRPVTVSVNVCAPVTPAVV